MNQKDLEREIQEYQSLYYSGIPSISDEEFDILWERLKNEFPNSPLLEQVGDDNIDENKFPHEIMMGSQEKITSEKELKDWVRLKNITGDVVIQEKLDGISVELIYENGKMIRALTRGNGEIGSDITKNIINVPTVNEKKRFSVRGEVVLRKSKYKEIQQEGKVISLRNLAAGIAYQKNSFDNLDKISVICYDTNLKFNTEMEKIIWLMENRFEVPKIVMHEIEDIDSIMTAIGAFELIRPEQDYDIDGLVIKQNIIPSVVENRARPHHQRAFKWESEKAITIINDVEWSRSGNNYTPVAILEPVELSGAIVTRASLANLGEVSRLNLRIPSKVFITRRGEIIPKILSVYEEIEGSKKPEIPMVCELCGEDLSVSPTRIYCANPDCPSVLEHRVHKWIEMTGALGFGPSTLDYLFYEMGYTHIHEYYCSNNIAEAISKTNKKKALQKAFAELLARSTKIKLEDFVSGFDMPTIGSKVVKLLVDAGYNTLDKLRKVKYDELIKIDGIGPERAKIFVEEMIRNYDAMDAVLETNRVSIIEDNMAKIENDKGSLEGKSFCMTGKLSKPRNEIIDFIESNGGKVSSTVTKNVTYLVTDDPNSGSSKNEKAKKLGVSVISEEELMELAR